MYTSKLWRTMSNSKQRTPVDYEALAEAVKQGIDRLISATKRSNGKQISFQVGKISRDMIDLSNACMADIQPEIIT